MLEKLFNKILNNRICYIRTTNEFTVEIILRKFIQQVFATKNKIPIVNELYTLTD